MDTKTQRIRQNELTEECVPNKGLSQNLKKKTKNQKTTNKQTKKTKLNEMEINNQPNKAFLEMIINMLSVLRRRMGEHSETFLKRVKKHKESNRAKEYNN